MTTASNSLSSLWLPPGFYIDLVSLSFAHNQPLTILYRNYMYELLGFRHHDHDIQKKYPACIQTKFFFHGLGISTSRKDKETIADYVLDITIDFFLQF